MYQKFKKKNLAELIMNHPALFQKKVKNHERTWILHITDKII